jgi:hypothetical protein
MASHTGWQLSELVDLPVAELLEWSQELKTMLDDRRR